MTKTLTPPTYCTCERPQPHERAAHKGLAETVCKRCGLPVRLTLGRA